MVWHDLNRNGAFDAGEGGVEGVTLCYYALPLPNTSPLVPTDCTVSGTDGSYSFVNVLAGPKIVFEQVPSGYTQSWPSNYMYLENGYRVVLDSDASIVNGLDFGVYQPVPPPPDVTVVQQSGTLDGLPAVVRSGLTALTLRKDLSAYDVAAAQLEMRWNEIGFTTTVDMAEDDGTGVWEGNVPPPFPYGYPGGDASLTFFVDIIPAGPGSEDLIEVGDVIFYDPSGQIRDQCTNLPLEGATVTLYLYDMATKSSTLCPLANIRTPDPPTNTIVTGPDGMYLWMTTGGYYHVRAQMPGYVTEDSPVVQVPPPVTGLDVLLDPVGGCGGVTEVYLLTITVQHLLISSRGSTKVEMRGKITLAAESDGIDPAADGMNVGLLLPGGLPGSYQFYPAIYALPVQLRATPGGWAITRSEKARTGIQALEIRKTRDPLTFAFHLVDRNAGIAAQDYRKITVMISSGNDRGLIDITLREKKGSYVLA